MQMCRAAKEMLVEKIKSQANELTLVVYLLLIAFWFIAFLY